MFSLVLLSKTLLSAILMHACCDFSFHLIFVQMRQLHLEVKCTLGILIWSIQTNINLSMFNVLFIALGLVAVHSASLAHFRFAKEDSEAISLQFMFTNRVLNVSVRCCLATNCICI